MGVPGLGCGALRSLLSLCPPAAVCLGSQAFIGRGLLLKLSENLFVSWSVFCGRMQELPAGLLLGEASLSPPRCLRRGSARSSQGLGWWSTAVSSGGTLETLESRIRAKSRVSPYHRGFIFSGASGEAFVLCGCSKELQGQAGRRHWVFGRHAQWIRQGPRGHGPACAAQMGGGCQAGGPGLFPGRRVGLGPLAQDGKCSLTVASLLWGPVSRAHCVRKSV